ncbi:MAG TPA: YihY/virulence factor BrkB family protein [Candidatus Kapabacteria bacterium]|jgi:membrane protein|nr:YihY/virulence factor BrkB family protein [Candidatus Kapabacteria bacterium]
MSLLLRMIITAYTFMRATIQNASSHNVFLLSAGIAYNALLCVIPLMLVGLSLAGLLISQEQVEQAVLAFIRDFFPETSFRVQAGAIVLSEVRKFYAYGSAAGGIGLLVLLWSASVLLSAVRTSLNHIFGIIPRRSYIINKIRDMGLTLLFLVLLGIASFIPSAIAIFISFGSQFSSDLPIEWLTGITAEIVGIVSLFLFFLFMYRILPNKKLPRMITYGSSIIAVVLWEIARYIFAWYVATISSFGSVYGVFAVLTIIAVWIYYTGFIVLFTAESTQTFYQLQKTSQ